MSAQLSSLHYEALKEKLQKRHRGLQETLWDKHAEALEWLASYSKEMAIASMSGLMLLSTPIAGLLPATSTPPPAQHDQYMDLDPGVMFQTDLAKDLPSTVEPLTVDQEHQVSKLLSDYTGFSVTPELQGIRLNTSYGYIGQEQHLARYPGDSMDSHFESDKDRELYADKGMAPGLGAWGYFASSRDTMTVKNALQEKWYIAVQTFLAPGFADHTGEYITFFKFRKMLVVNPDNGKMVVADIADAGPAQFTGKQLGGSPELMKYLGRVDGAQKGPVLYFFVDDPNDTIPLGPVQGKESESQSSTES